MENTTENNKLIAEFMGWWTDGSGNYRVDNVRFDVGYKRTKEMKFHASWDWLMPVISEVRDLSKIINEVEMDTWYNYMKEVLPFADIDNAYANTVEFIKWHNNR